jgi:hypothetical protein
MSGFSQVEMSAFGGGHGGAKDNEHGTATGVKEDTGSASESAPSCSPRRHKLLCFLRSPFVAVASVPALA